MQFAASYVARECYPAQVIFRDSIALRESYRTYFRFLLEEKPDFIVLETATPSWDHDAQVIAEIHRLLPCAKIVVTGPIAAARGVEILQGHPVYAVVKGEAEKGLARVINGSSGLIEFDLMTEAEMNAAPFPMMTDDVWDHYWDCNPVGSLHPQLQVWSSRGCIYKCIFCSWPAVMTNDDSTGEGRRIIRKYSADFMLGYLTEMTERYKFKGIYDDSDWFNCGDKHTLAMAGVYRKIGLPWTAMCRADSVKRETWKAMKDAGCIGAKIGFESGVSRVVNDIVHKQLDLNKAVETVHFLKSIGMTVHGTFTLGLPGETPEEVQQTRAFAASLPLDSLQMSGTAEIEGTPLATLAQVGKLKTYPGAVTDENYRPRSDGNAKLQEMAK